MTNVHIDLSTNTLLKTFKHVSLQEKLQENFLLSDINIWLLKHYPWQYKCRLGVFGKTFDGI